MLIPFSSYPERKISDLFNIVRIMILILFLFLTVYRPAFADGLSRVNGEKLHLISLPAPEHPDEKNYLGLSGKEFFRISEIRAEGLLIEVLNAYCPICQTTAPAMVELYRQIEDNPDLKHKIKLIGVGVGNNVLETEMFRQTYGIPFPVFPDENYEIHKELGEVRTPFIMILKRNGNGYQEIVHTHLGGITDAREFLSLVGEVYGIKQEDLLIQQAGSSPFGPSPTMVP
jgi:hypothetical protein